MSFQDTNKALTQGYIDLALGLPTAYEGVAFEPPHAADWASLFILPAVNEPVTLGIGGEDEEAGLMQLDFYTEQGHSTDTLLSLADTVQQNFVAGKGYTNDQTTAIITSVERTPIRPDGGWLRITLNVNFISRFERPAI